jgi:hypothetical protein
MLRTVAAVETNVLEVRLFVLKRHAFALVLMQTALLTPAPQWKGTILTVVHAALLVQLGAWQATVGATLAILLWPLQEARRRKPLTQPPAVLALGITALKKGPSV